MRNKDALFKARGDISSGEIKFVKDEICIAAQLELLVPEGEAEDLFKADAGDSWEAGPFAVRLPISFLLHKFGKYDHKEVYACDAGLSCCNMSMPLDRR